MKTKHTPGPWRIGFLDGSGANCEEGAWLLAGHAGDETVVIRGGADDYGIPHGVDNEANARLIAAAPDLLEACRYIVDAGEDGDEVTAIEKARAALAKAEGREP